MTVMVTRVLALSLALWATARDGDDPHRINRALPGGVPPVTYTPTGRGDDVRTRARRELGLTGAYLEDFLVRPPHFDFWGIHEHDVTEGERESCGGDVIVADSHKHNLGVIKESGEFVKNYGRNGTELGEFFRPRGLAEGKVTRTRVQVDGYATDYEVPVLYVADYGNNRVQMLRLADGMGMKSYGTLGIGIGELDGPEYVHMHEGTLYVVDRNNHRIVVLDNELNYISEFGGYGTGNGQFQYPAHVGVYNGLGYEDLKLIWVGDRDGAIRVQQFWMNLTWRGTVRSSGGPQDYVPPSYGEHQFNSFSA